jgi:signal transduction protein with GAF and PtsI domain
VRVSVSGSPEGVGLLSKKTTVFAGLRADARFAAAARVREQELESGMAAVVKRGEKPWGVLVVFTRNVREFSPAEEKFLEAIGAILGAVLTGPSPDPAVSPVSTRAGYAGGREASDGPPGGRR